MKKLLLLTMIFIGGCVVPPQFVIDTPSGDQVRSAQNEISRKGNIYKNNLSRSQKLNRLTRVKNKLYSPAKRLCLALGERSNCSWEVYYQDEPEINAYATEGDDGPEIVIFMGVLDHTHSDEELAFVVAHEISHHILNHISDDTGFTLGETIGILAGLAIIGDDDYDPDAVSLEDMTDLLGLTKNIGGAFDRPQYSRSQESESDYLAIQILDDANYDLNMAKQGIINIAASSENTSSSPPFLGSHPSGPQRLASFNSNMKVSNREILINKINIWCNETTSWNRRNFNCSNDRSIRRESSAKQKKTSFSKQETKGFEWVFVGGRRVCRGISSGIIFSISNCQ